MTEFHSAFRCILLNRKLIYTASHKESLIWIWFSFAFFMFFLCLAHHWNFTLSHLDLFILLLFTALFWLFSINFLLFFTSFHLSLGFIFLTLQGERIFFFPVRVRPDRDGWSIFKVAVNHKRNVFVHLLWFIFWYFWYLFTLFIWKNAWDCFFLCLYDINFLEIDV